MFSFSSFADELEDLMLKQLKSNVFLWETYSDSWQGFQVVEGKVEVFTKVEARELMKAMNEENIKPNYKSVKFLSRSETQDFVSLTFEYEWELTYGNTNMNGKASGVSVYLKTDEGYISIFDAQTQ